jgi:hypothetical protein
MIMNRIVLIQNEKLCLQLLAAQRQLYADAKRLLGWQMMLGGPAATVAALIGILFPATREFVALWGVAVIALDVLWLTPRQKRLREAGARVQEKFDCHVLGLNWDTTRAGQPEPAELVLEQSTRYATWAAKMTPLTDWYPRDVGQLPVQLARLVCQRTNCWWDAHQRRRYAAVMAGLLLSAFLAVLATGVLAKLSVPSLLLIVGVPMASTLRLAHQQWIEHREAADRLDRLRDRVERVWRDALANPGDPALAQEARALQGEIFDGRKRNPLVFDFVFKLLRNDMEAQMNYGAQQFVLEAKERLPQPT